MYGWWELVAVEAVKAESSGLLHVYIADFFFAESAQQVWNKFKKQPIPYRQFVNSLRICESEVQICQLRIRGDVDSVFQASVLPSCTRIDFENHKNITLRKRPLCLIRYCSGFRNSLPNGTSQLPFFYRDTFSYVNRTIGELASTPMSGAYLSSVLFGDPLEVAISELHGEFDNEQ